MHQVAYFPDNIPVHANPAAMAWVALVGTVNTTEIKQPNEMNTANSANIRPLSFVMKSLTIGDKP
jgi:hypothetical protein